MSKLILFKVLSDAQLNALHSVGAQAGAEVKAAIDHTPSAIIAALQNSSIGNRILDAIKTIDDSDLKWYEKLEHVVVNDAVPELVSLATTGGVQAGVTDVEDLGYALVSTIYTKFKEPAETVLDGIEAALDLKPAAPAADAPTGAAADQGSTAAQ